MREIDEVRIMLLRLLSDTAQFPSALIDQILKASEFVKRHMASIKVNAYGRGLLTRYRQHSLYVKNFNKQAHFRASEWQTITSQRWGMENLGWDDIEMKEQGIRALRKTRGYRHSKRTLRTSVVDTSRDRVDPMMAQFGATVWPDWSMTGPWCRVEWAQRLTEARTDWWKSRNRLGVKLLDFGEP
jgi:hypothetical protein